MTMRYLGYTACYLVVIAGLIFLGAGDLRWRAAWVFIAEYALVAGAIVVWLVRHDPDLLRERFAAPVHRDQAWWDRVFITGVGAFFLAWLVLMGVDGRRYNWSHVPVALQVIGALAFATSMYVTWMVFRVNTFAVPQARSQAQRGQTVISDGPYAIVRHPMYSGGLLFFFGIPLLLNSWLGLVVGVLLTIAMSFRIIGEEQILRRNLAGYDAYIARVKWRLVPGVW